MSFWDNPEYYTAKGIDGDLDSCLNYNPQPFRVDDIEKVLAVWEGESDGDDWRWIIKITPQAAKEHGGRYVFLQGGCDYTGWDCQSWASSEFSNTALKAARLSEVDDVYEKLAEQIRAGKNKTWREQKNEELNVNDIPKI